MNILITGNAGLLGSRLADWILENTDHCVVGMDDLSGGYEENIRHVEGRTKFYKIDLASHHEELGRIFSEEDIDVIYHFAAYAAEGLSPFIRRFNYQNNLIASTNLINMAIKHDVKRFVFASSMAVYGDKHVPPFSEDMRPNPIDPYGIAKYGVEQDLACAHAQHGLEYTIIRPHNVYGRGQNIWDKYRNVLGIWMYQIINNQQPTIFGDGLQERAFSYIDDCLLPLWKASQLDSCKSQTINLGGTKKVSIKDACNEVIKVTGTSLEPLYLEQRHEAKYAYSTWQKSVDLLDFDHKTDISVGLEKMWEWAKTQPNRERMVWKDFELEKGIYSFWKNKQS